MAVQHGEAFATEVGRLVQTELAPLHGILDCRAKWIELAFDTLPTHDQWQALAESKSAPIAYHAQKNLARLDRGEELPTHLPYLVQTWSFGDDLTMVFLPGEVVVDYSLRIKREFDRSRLWVHGYANDVQCYIPSRRILDEGGYEGAGAMVYFDRPTKLAADVEERIFAALRVLIPAEFVAQPGRVLPAEPLPGVPYPDRSQLLVVRDAAGNERPVETAADWAQRVTHIRANMQQVMGLMHDTSRWAPLDVEIVSDEQTAKYLRRKVRFTPEIGDRVPAWLLLNKQRSVRSG